MIRIRALPPAEAIAFFEQKGYAIGFDWRDVWQSEQQAAFTVAKVMRLDLLREIRSFVDEAIKNGSTFAEFSKQITPRLQKKGWWGIKPMRDPLTDEVRDVQLGSPKRLKVIYDTNLRTAHAEGQWYRIQQTKSAFPYLMYDGNNSEHPRVQHSQWDGLVLPVDDPFWGDHMPVKAWGCKCRVIPYSAKQLDSRGLKPSEAPAVPRYEYMNKRTGEVQQIPMGVDPAFNYPPGGRQAYLDKLLAGRERGIAQ